MKAALLLLLLLLTGCGITPYQKFMDQVDRDRASLMSPDMTARICAAGADTEVCRHGRL